ncbi:phytanoyl-CoA dioxygenase family protein [Roseomonas sp. HJA6]|uniref:Phytanoyl-CoA dioxygenase family protein n=1 Tax=Roseomonas alba TaxID=2846776 RepID=A0ABS7A7C0_9PROT|nr:phytanoyl-CoA dioxygenase family protein [Neoroseomonas alba]MBW6398025.1 phytanoyl-CoA dioxygenase family protein [Neoroseomonas alba]
MIAYAQINPRLPGFRLGRALAYYAQRVVTPTPLRRAVTGGIALVIRSRHGAGPTRPSRQRELGELRGRGIAMLAPLFSEETLRSVQDYFHNAPVTLPGGRQAPLAEIPAGTRSAAYDLQTIVDCPHLLEAVNDPELLSLAAAYLGCKPTLSSLGVRWSFPNAVGREDVQTWHRDCDDWRTIKVFTYLTDVCPTSGPHAYVRGSHRTRATLRNARFTEDGLTDRFGQDSILSVMGPSGTSFVGDMAGIHRGVVPKREPRLILQAQFSVLPIQCFDYNPVRRPGTPALDAYTNRLIVRG